MFGLLLGFYGALSVAGASTCPSPQEIQRRLAQLLPESAEGQALVVVRDEGLELKLVDAKGVTLAERTLPSSANCDGLATAAAVALASLIAEFPPQPPQAPTRLVLISHLPEDSEPLPHPTWNVELGLGLLGSWTDNGSTPGGLALISLGGMTTPWRLQGLFLAEGRRDLPFASGAIVWQRWALGLGGGYRLTGKAAPFALELDAALWEALLTTHTADFLQNPSATRLDSGGGVGARLTFALGPWMPWLGLWSVGWLSHVIELQGSATGREFPQLELLASLGLSLRFSSGL